MRGTHGMVGGNLFLTLYVLAMAIPALRLLPGGSIGQSVAALLLMLVTAVSATHAIRTNGGGGAGEPLGLMAGVLAWVGRFAGGGVASYVGAASDGDLFRIVGGSAPVLLAVATFWVLGRAKRA